MRVMVLVKANTESEAGVLPSPEFFAAMGKFNEELVKAGIMQAGEGLKPSAKGTRVRFAGKERTVNHGPFPHTEELVAGFWLWQVKSKDEAIDWLKRAPFEDATVEIRPLYEAEDFASSDPSGELRESEARLRAETERRKP
ncbi:MAG: YciI family protein [Stellaceae bacterium]